MGPSRGCSASLTATSCRWRRSTRRSCTTSESSSAMTACWSRRFARRATISGGSRRRPASTRRLRRRASAAAACPGSPRRFVLEALNRKYGPGPHLHQLGDTVSSHRRCWPASSTARRTCSFRRGPAIRSEVLPQVLAGEKTVCFGVTEPGAGSDLWGLKTKARRDGDDWVINGSKAWITNAPYCDYAAVFAITDEETFAAHKGGLTAFLLDAKAPASRRTGRSASSATSPATAAASRWTRSACETTT